MKVLLCICLVLSVFGALAKSPHKHNAESIHNDLLKETHRQHPQDTKEAAIETVKHAEAQKTVIKEIEVEGIDGADRIRKDDEREKTYHPSIHENNANSQVTGVDWVQRAQDELSVSLNSWPKWYKAQNAIYFIGDGMGMSTLTAGRMYKAQLAGQSVTEGKLSWENMPYTGIAKTYNTDQQVPDSAGTATAFICGEKTRESVICVNENVPLNDCDAVAGNELRSLLHRAMDEGKWGGIVTTTRLTHATPAAAYAVSCARGWEADSDIPIQHRAKCPDIARQLVEKNDTQRIRVILGGGRREFFPDSMFDNEYPTYAGNRQDGRDLRQEWLDLKASSGLLPSDYSYVENKTDFDNVDASTIQYLFGMFEPSHMKFEADREEETGTTWTEPDLSEMVKKALDILKRAPNGYFLYVEGGRIDHAHHDNNAHRALRDVVSLDKAVEVAMNETSDNDTLIMVTADHSHVFTMAGYQPLDNHILDPTRYDNGTERIVADLKGYLTLQYANGPGWLEHRSPDGTYRNETFRKDVRGENTRDKDYLQDGTVPMPSETHGGEDVAIYARGPMSHLLSGQHEQHYIPHAVGYAMCIGWNTGFCDNNPPPPGPC